MTSAVLVVIVFALFGITDALTKIANELHDINLELAARRHSDD